MRPTHVVEDSIRRSLISSRPQINITILVHLYWNPVLVPEVLKVALNVFAEALAFPKLRFCVVILGSIDKKWKRRAGAH